MPLLDTIEEATRLTREGRLKEAMALLTGGRATVAPVRTPDADEGRAARTPRPTGALWDRPKTASPLDLSARQPLRGKLGAGLRGAFDGLGPRGPAVGLDVGTTPVPVPDGASFEERSFVSEQGSLAYKLYVPSRAGTTMPLVVMLHGCTQSPDDFALGTRMNELAEAQGVLVAYPAQSRSANASKCWNWFRAGDQQRGRGEPALIAGMVRQILREHPVDPDRIYAAGLSAGGAAAAVLGQTYPELFAAVGVHSGLACGAAADMGSAFSAMKNGAAAPRLGASLMPTLVFHGDHDGTVSPINGAQVIAQAEGGSGLSTTIDSGHSPGGVAYTRTVQADARGLPMLEHWVLHGAGHAWSGGDPAGSYTDPRGPDASAAMLRFFGHHAQGQRG